MGPATAGRAGPPDLCPPTSDLLPTQSNIQNLKFKIAWPIIAAILLLAAALTASESTGVTHLSATVIRIVRGDGTLVVEIDDPSIQVLLDGDEIAITGAGPKELRLRPGEHELQTVKGGKPSDTKLITITRDGREVVKVAREQSAAPAREQPSAVPTSTSTRLVWADALNLDGDISSDGKYLAYVDYKTGDLVVRDLAIDKNRRLTNKGSWTQSIEFALSPKFSADGTQLAYTWFNNENKFDLRVIEVEGGDPRVVYPNKVGGLFPDTCGWTPDGKAILATLRPPGESRNPGDPAPLEQQTMQLALIGTADGFVRTIKTFESRRGSRGNMREFSLAPDGRTIAYSRIVEPASAHHDIFLIHMETGQETQVTTYAADKTILGWTPDGQRLVFDMERQGARDAWLIRIGGGKPQGEAELVKKDLGAIVPLGFTRDGTFYYGSSSQGPQLCTATLDLEKGTAAATPLAGEKFNISDQLRLGDWSPDGEYLAYLANVIRRVPGDASNSQEIRIVSMKTGQTRVLKQDLTFIQTRMRWSPDGRSILAAGTGTTAAGTRRRAGIYQIDAVSGQATVVVEGSGVLSPAWSRDGQGIFFSRMPYLLGVPNFLARTVPIVFRDLQTKAERDVLTPGDPDFDGKLDFWFEPSPDGRQLALLAEPNGQSMALWLVPVDGASRELLKVNTPGTFAGGVGWTPDGRFVLFTQLGGDEAQRGLWFVSANGGAPRKVALTGTDPKTATRLAVHPDGKQLALTAQGTGKSEIWALENFLPPPADAN